MQMLSPKTETLCEAPAEKGLGDARILAKGAGVSLTGGVAAQGLSMVSQILMARLLGAADFGLYSIGWTLVRLFPPLTTLGLDSGVIYFGARFLRSNTNKFKGVVGESITFAFLSGLTVGAALYFAAPFLATRVLHKPDALSVIRAFGPAFPLYAVLIVASSVTALSQRMQYIVYCGVGFTASALMFVCISFLFGFRLFGAVESTVAGITVGTLMSLFFIRFLFPAAFAKETTCELMGSELMSYCIPLVLAGLAASTLALIDRLFVASFCSAADTGVYQVASQLSILFSIFHGAFQNMFSPMVADLHARHEATRLAELYRVCAKWSLYASIPAFLVILFAAPELVQLIYGRSYVTAARPLAILSFGKAFMITAAAAGPVLLMTGFQNIFVAIPLVVLPIDVFLNLALVPSFGTVGAATATAVSALTLNATAILAVRAFVGIWPFDLRCVKGIVALSVAFGILCILRPLDSGPPALTLLIVACTSVGVFTGCLFALGLDVEDWEILRMFRTHVRWLVQPFRPAYRS